MRGKLVHRLAQVSGSEGSETRSRPGSRDLQYGPGIINAKWPSGEKCRRRAARARSGRRNARQSGSPGGISVNHHRMLRRTRCFSAVIGAHQPASRLSAPCPGSPSPGWRVLRCRSSCSALLWVRGHSSVARAPGVSPGGEGFDSLWLHQPVPVNMPRSASIAEVLVISVGCRPASLRHRDLLIQIRAR